MTIKQKAESAETKTPYLDQETSKEENIESYDLIDEELQHIELEHDNLVDEELEKVQENPDFSSKPDQDKIVHNEFLEALELAIFEQLEIDNDVLEETKDDKEGLFDKHLVHEGEEWATTNEQDIFYLKDKIINHTQESKEEVKQETLNEINSDAVVSKSKTFDILDE